MDREDQRRYLVVGSVILEVVTPLFQQKIENDYKAGGFGSFRHLSTVNQLFTPYHLRHRNSWCCKRQIGKCHNHAALPCFTANGKNYKINHANVHLSIQAVSSTVTGLEQYCPDNSSEGYNCSKLLHKGLTCECGRQIIIPICNDQPRRNRKQYQIGKDIFFLHNQLNLQSLFNADKMGFISTVKMMDDGRLMVCSPYKDSLLLCNTDISQIDSLPVQVKMVGNSSQQLYSGCFSCKAGQQLYRGV
ncbi:unnamed protein product [Mytilus edulis]|uniref:Uncharacterized protein n=1 Tax=Mytilus edulis TaxID=6550 RepID=A0A8S3T349_MYTED|nr:unnamed protein product [Mytilus edulis]